MASIIPPLLAPCMFCLGLAAAELPLVDALPSMSEVYNYVTNFVPSHIGYGTSSRAVTTNELCWSLLSVGPTSAQYLACKNELENLVVDLLAKGYLDLEKCVMSKAQQNTAECPVLIWMKPHMISVTHPLVVDDIQSRFAPKGEVYEYFSEAVINGVKSVVKITVHGYPPNDEESDDESVII